MFDPNDLHICLIGYNHQLNLYLNLDIIRKNYSFGDKIWVTTLYNGTKDGPINGLGENSYIPLEYNRGYQLGAFDLYKEAFRMAKLVNRKYTIVMNFDVWIVGEQAMVNLMEDFIQSGKRFMSGRDPNHDRPFCDITIYQTEHIPDLEEKYIKERNPHKVCLEEWLYRAMCVKYFGEDFTYQEKMIDPYWHEMDRGEDPFFWSEKTKILHTHIGSLKRECLIANRIDKGNFVRGLLKG